MWNDIVYDRGGLALHAGLQGDPDRRRREGVHDHRPVGHRQDDDDVHDAERLAAGAGRLRRADARRQARTAPRTGASRRRSRSIPTSSRTSTAPSSSRPPTWRTSYQDDAGKVNFFEESYTQNGRAVFAHVGPRTVPRRAGRRHGRLPADPQPEREHHPGRGQARRRSRPPRTSCSARRRARARAARRRPGKFLRVPGTNPFFPLPHGLQGNRILELLATHPIETYLMNTGPRRRQGRRRSLQEAEDPAHLGMREGDRRAARSRGPGTRSSATWSRRRCRASTTSSSCSRAVSTSARDGSDEYAQIVDRLKSERVARLQEFPELSDDIVKAVG